MAINTGVVVASVAIWHESQTAAGEEGAALGVRFELLA